MMLLKAPEQLLKGPRGDILWSKYVLDKFSAHFYLT